MRIETFHRRLSYRTGSFTLCDRTVEHVDSIEVVVTQQGWSGRGECVPYARYGESIASVQGQLDQLPPTVTRQDLPAFLRAGPARNALDCALWDLEAKRTGRPVWELAGLAPPAPVATMRTLSTGSPQQLARDAARFGGIHGILKLLVKGPDILPMVDLVHAAAPSASIVIDARESWSLGDYLSLAPMLARLKVIMVEQPLPAKDDDLLAGIRRPLPVCADESCHEILALPRLRGRYDAVNIKLDKAGGLTAALALRDAARREGLKVMAGSLISSSLATAPAILVAQGADYVDLDGPLLLQEDQAMALRSKGALVHPAPPGIWG